MCPKKPANSKADKSVIQGLPKALESELKKRFRVNVYDGNGRRLGKATFSWNENGKTRMYIDNSPMQGGLSKMGNCLLAVRGNYMDAQGNMHNPVYVKESEWSDAQQPEEK